MKQLFFPEVAAGGFTRIDGTIEFYFRVNSLLKDGATVLDIGAGRGANSESSVPAIRSLYSMKLCKTHIIGLDLDPIVLTNPLVDQAEVYDGKKIPLEDSSVDLIVSDYTFEHVQEPELFASELLRVLRPGGWICARTPYLISMLVLASSIAPNRSHKHLLSAVQPGRKSEDVFPTVYKMNTYWAIRRLFPMNQFDHCSYTYSPEPSYHFNSRIVFACMLAYQNLKRLFLGGEVFMIFLRKR